MRRNVLIFHQGALGDFVLTWPLGLALGRLFAQSRIVYVTHGQKGELAGRVLRVEYSDVENGWHQLYGVEPRLPEPAEKLLAGAHSIFSFVAGDQDLWLANARTLAPDAQIVRLDPRPPEDYRGHFTDFVVEQLGLLPAVQASVIAMTRAIKERGLKGLIPPDETVVIHPGSGGEHKCWPRRNFEALVIRLRDSGKQVRVILGEAERDRWPSDDIDRFGSLGEVVFPATLLDLCEQLRRAAAVVTNDSGPAHLAGMLGVRTLVLFGASNATIWRPLGPAVRLLQQKMIDEIRTENVYDTLIKLLDA